jgi:RimJ/RimL family protein N-acetyltransferase
MLGYAIGRTWWGLGIATEAAKAVMAWGIETFGLTRVWASTDIRHIRSQRVMEKLGMIRESVKAGHHQGRYGESIDEVVYGLSCVGRDSPRH